jgi:hypothetical protein
MSNILNFSKLAKALKKIQPKQSQSFTTIFVDTTSYCDEEIEHGFLQYSESEIQESYVLALEQSIIDYCVANQFKLTDGDIIVDNRFQSDDFEYKTGKFIYANNKVNDAYRSINDDRPCLTPDICIPYFPFEFENAENLAMQYVRWLDLDSIIDDKSIRDHLLDNLKLKTFKTHDEETPKVKLLATSIYLGDSPLIIDVCYYEISDDLGKLQHEKNGFIENKYHNKAIEAVKNFINKVDRVAINSSDVEGDSLPCNFNLEGFYSLIGGIKIDKPEKFLRLNN